MIDAAAEKALKQALDESVEDYVANAAAALGLSFEDALVRVAAALRRLQAQGYALTARGEACAEFEAGRAAYHAGAKWSASQPEDWRRGWCHAQHQHGQERAGAARAAQSGVLKKPKGWDENKGGGDGRT